jgi:hypothetical protein
MLAAAACGRIPVRLTGPAIDLGAGRGNRVCSRRYRPGHVDASACPVLADVDALGGGSIAPGRPARAKKIELENARRRTTRGAL